MLQAKRIPALDTFPCALHASGGTYPPHAAYCLLLQSPCTLQSPHSGVLGVGVAEALAVICEREVWPLTLRTEGLANNAHLSFVGILLESDMATRWRSLTAKRCSGSLVSIG